MNTKNIVHPLKKVVVLLGGRSSEREVSLSTGKAVAKALERQNCEVTLIDWQGKSSVKQLLNDNYDCAFIALHGMDGEDGCIQSLLEILELPYTGSGILANALCMDKLKTKQLLRASGLPLLPDINLSVNRNIPNEEIVAQLGFPLCVKPVNQGSSVGIYKATTLDELAQARMDAAAFGGEVMVEPWIIGGEYTVGFLNGKPLPSIRIVPKRDFYDYDAKYISRDTEYRCPSGLDDTKELEIQNLAKRAFDAAGCHDWGRVDFVCDTEGNFFILEINTIPGMTDTSLVPKAAAHVGISFDALVLQITINASLKHGSKLQLKQDNQVWA